MRYISFTFDDCLLDGALKVDKILEPYKATFYLVSGWIKPNNKHIVDSSNIDCNHGSVEDWKALSDRGHEMGAHTESHVRMFDDNIYDECKNSLDFIKTIKDEPPFAFATPFFDEVNSKIVDLFHSIRIGYKRVNFYNNITNFNIKRLWSWGPVSEGRTVETSCEIIRKAPDNSWIILTMHSLDGEGFHPLSSEQLKEIKDFVLSLGFQIKTVKQMTIITNEYA